MHKNVQIIIPLDDAPSSPSLHTPLDFGEDRSFRSSHHSHSQGPQGPFAFGNQGSSKQGSKNSQELVSEFGGIPGPAVNRALFDNNVNTNNSTVTSEKLKNVNEKNVNATQIEELKISFDYENRIAPTDGSSGEWSDGGGPTIPSDSPYSNAFVRPVDVGNPADDLMAFHAVVPEKSSQKFGGDLVVSSDKFVAAGGQEGTGMNTGNSSGLGGTLEGVSTSNGKDFPRNGASSNARQQQPQHSPKHGSCTIEKSDKDFETLFQILDIDPSSYISSSSSIADDFTSSIQGDTLTSSSSHSATANASVLMANRNSSGGTATNSRTPSLLSRGFSKLFSSGHDHAKLNATSDLVEKTLNKLIFECKVVLLAELGGIVGLLERLVVRVGNVSLDAELQNNCNSIHSNARVVQQNQNQINDIQRSVQPASEDSVDTNINNMSCVTVLSSHVDEILPASTNVGTNVKGMESSIELSDSPLMQMVIALPKIKELWDKRSIVLPPDFLQFGGTNTIVPGGPGPGMNILGSGTNAPLAHFSSYVGRRSNNYPKHLRPSPNLKSLLRFLDNTQSWRRATE